MTFGAGYLGVESVSAAFCVPAIRQLKGLYLQTLEHLHKAGYVSATLLDVVYSFQKYIPNYNWYLVKHYFLWSVRNLRKKGRIALLPEACIMVEKTFGQTVDIETQVSTLVKA